MGITTSSNAAAVITKALAKVSSDIIADTHLSTDSSQIISVNDTDGDVVVRGNKFAQKAR